MRKNNYGYHAESFVCDYLEAAIDTKKQKRIIKSAEQYMRKTGCRLQPRFDAAYVSSYNGEDLSLEYILNAFDASGV